jgi:hypothetical protein
MSLANIREQGLAPTEYGKRLAFVGGCPRSRMPALALTSIRAQGCAPTT